MRSYVISISAAILVALLLLSTGFAVANMSTQTSTNQAQSDKLKESNLDGEFVDLSCQDPYIGNLSGKVKICDNGDGTVDISVTKVVAGNKSTVTNYLRIPVQMQTTVTQDGKKYINGLIIDDPNQSIFVTVSLLDNGDGWLSLTTSTMYGQYHLEGLIEKPLTIKASKERVSEGTMNNGEIVLWDGNTRVKPSAISTKDGLKDIIPSKAGIKQKSAIIENTNKSKTIDSADNGVIQPMGPIQPRYWGIVHNEFSDSMYNHNAPPTVINKMAATLIDRTLYRAAPTRDQILSDYQTYTRYYYGNELLSNVLLAYQLCCHGKDTQSEPDRILGMPGVFEISPSDVTACWTSASDYYSRPEGTLLFVHACRSAYDGGPSDTSEMANAWLNYGAEAYVGFTIKAYYNIDNFENRFWDRLCYDYWTVSQAEADATPLNNRPLEEGGGPMQPADVVVLGNANWVML